MYTENLNNDRQVILSTLWIFYVFNILYADVLNLMGQAPVESSDEIVALLSTEMLMGAAVILEMAMVMILLSRILKYSVNRWLNIAVGIFQLLVVSASLFVGTPTSYYIFFALIEIATLIFIVWYSWRWSSTNNKQNPRAGNVG